MPGGDSEHSIRGAVVEGKLHADLFHSHIAHDSPASNIQKLVVAGNLAAVKKGLLQTEQSIVIRFRSLKICGIILFRKRRQSAGVAYDCPGLGALVPGVCKGRVAHDHDTKEKDSG